MHVPAGDDPGQHVFLPFGIGLVGHALVAHPDGPGFVGVDPGNDVQGIFHLFLDFGQTVAIVHHSVLIVRGAGTDDQQKAAVFPGEDVPDLSVPAPFGFIDGRLHRVINLQFLGRGHFADELHFKFHCIPPFGVNCIHYTTKTR